MIISNHQFAGNNAVSANTFDPSKLSSLMSGRNNRFHLDLSNHTLVAVLEAYASFKRRTSPRFTNSAVIGAIISLEQALNVSDPSLGVLMPIDVTDIFYDEFRCFLMSRKTNRGTIVKPSTIRNYFDNIRAALSWGALHKCPVSETFNSYTIESYEATKVVLTPSQIAHIYYFDININKPRIRAALEQYPIRRFSFTVLEKVRDQFVFEANTAQRYSDASKITNENFDDTRTIMKVTQQKTGGRAKVNIPKYAIDKKIVYEILQKYSYQAPSLGMDITNFNKYLHLLLLAIGGEFLENIITQNKINGEIITERVPMWKMVASHTARRTFVTYHIKEGKNLLQIQRCTGHKDLRHLQTYCVLDDED